MGSVCTEFITMATTGGKKTTSGHCFKPPRAVLGKPHDAHACGWIGLKNIALVSERPSPVHVVNVLVESPLAVDQRYFDP